MAPVVPAGMAVSPVTALMVLLVWMLVPILKMAFTFSLEMSKSAKDVSATVAQVQQRDGDIAKQIEAMQQQNVQRDRLIDEIGVRQRAAQDANNLVLSEHTRAIQSLTLTVAQLATKVDRLNVGNPPQSAA